MKKKTLDGILIMFGLASIIGRIAVPILIVWVLWHFVSKWW